jgi:hypothetical protein
MAKGNFTSGKQKTLKDNAIASTNNSKAKEKLYDPNQVTTSLEYTMGEYQKTNNYKDITYIQDLEASLNLTEAQAQERYDYLTNKMMTTTMNGIEGLPYQFMPSVDARIYGTGRSTTDSMIGRKYAEKIMGRFPLLFLTPCFPQALADFSDSDTQNIVTMLLEKNYDEDLVTGQGRYYNVVNAYDQYYRYYNCMMSATAAFLGIYDKKIPSYTGNDQLVIGEYDWSKELNDDFKTFFDAKENLVFYLDNFNSVSENFSNDTTASSIADQINGVSDTSNELRFLLGGNSSTITKIADNVSDAVSSVTSALSDALGLEKLGGGIVGSLASDGINTLVNGGKIIFPEIWSNSDYSRDYSLEIKLRSPDHDSLSIYLNIIKPYCKLLCLVLPRVMENEKHYNANAYMSPFLVKAFSKGKFNIDMGIITTMSVTKGAECQWNDDGLPTQIDISITVKDLYSSLAMSGFESTGLIGNPFKATKQIWKIVNNTAYMDFLANMAGLNVGTMSVGRRVTMYKYLTNTSIKQYPARKFTQFDQSISRIMGRLYEIF